VAKKTNNIKCRYCKQVMNNGVGCTFAGYDEDKKRVPCVDDHCHDCNVTKGQLHHPGCDMERCPTCHGQLISCSCEDGDEEDND